MAESAYQQADIKKEQGDWKSAIALYQEVICLAPDFSWSYHNLGDCYQRMGEYASAVKAYHQAIALNPDFLWSHYSLGEALVQLSRWPEAVASYRQAQRIAPDNEQIPPKLAAALRQVLKQSPRDADSYKLLAAQLIAEEKTEDVIATYQTALHIQPRDTALALSLSQLLSETDAHQAQRLLERTSSSVIFPADICSPDELNHPQQVAALLKHTALFDTRYYRATNPALAALSDDGLLQHYIEQGSATGRQPNPLFDNDFYSAQQLDVREKQLNPLAHYYCFGHQNKSDPHPCFSTALYYELHGDIAAAQINPLEHYLSGGAREGRAAFADVKLSDLIENNTSKSPTTSAISESAEHLRAWQDATGSNGEPQTLGVYCSAAGNYFIAEIADCVAAALTAAGNSVVRLSEQDVPPDGLDGHWVIAPHEFFYLGEGMQWAKKQQWLEKAVMVNVEQPQTTWFSKAFHFLRHSKIIFDINVKAAAIMQSLGLPAYWLPLGYLADYAPFVVSEQLPDLRAIASLPVAVRQQLGAIAAPLAERPLDIHFIGTLNQRRETFFASSARWLSDYKCFLHIPPMGMPLLPGQDQALDTAAVIGISRRSKILLNVHRDNLPYFEWHRMIFHGLWQNTLVVTEPCHDVPGLVAGEHFVSCPLADMAEKMEWLLRSPAGQAEAERIRAAGHRAFRAQFDGSNIMAKALQLADKALDRQQRRPTL